MTTMKIFKSPAEYHHAVHFAEQLMELERALFTMLSHGSPRSGISAKAMRKRNWPKDSHRLARKLVADFNQRRPDLGTRDPILILVNKDFEALLASYAGRRLTKLYRKVDGELIKCVNVLQNWINSFGAEIEKVTGRPAFEWFELAATIAHINLPIEGIEGRRARLQRVSMMLDSTIAMTEFNWHEPVDADDKVEVSSDFPIAVCEPVDRFTFVCELHDAESNENEVCQAPDVPDDQAKVAMSPGAFKSDEENPPDCELKVDPNSRLAFWGNKQLTINSNADFNLLYALYVDRESVVTHTTLLNVVKPNAVAASVQVSTAPPEVREAAEHIRKAFKNAGCRLRIESVRKHGYRLRSSDK